MSETYILLPPICDKLGIKRLDLYMINSKRNVERWVSIWKDKATQIYDKAEMLLDEDRIAYDAYVSILTEYYKVKHELRFKRILFVVIVV